MSTKYTFLISVYHKEKPVYLKESLNSMLKQSLMPDQIVLVKDGPLTVELNEVITNFTEKFPDIFTIVSLPQNVGLGLALNKGIVHCRNEFIARMDSDDISHVDRMKIQMTQLNDNKELAMLGTFTGEFINSVDDIKSSREVPTDYANIIKFSKRRSPFNHATVVFKKSALKSVNGYRDILRNEDYDLFVRLLMKNFYGENINKVLYFVRSDEDLTRRRTSWTNCKNYIKVVYNFWRWGYSSIFDLCFVAATQLGMFMLPTKLVGYISNKFLRKGM